MKFVFTVLFFVSGLAHAECTLEAGALMNYENQILTAATKREYKKMAHAMSCILQMQSDTEGMSRYMANSFLRPMMGGRQINGAPKDPRYKVVAQAMEELVLKYPKSTQEGFIAEFSRGDWRFYTLFCEEGNTEFCSRFLPEKDNVKNQTPLMAAASMLRLRKAYTVLKGPQKELVADRLKELYKDIPVTDRLKRKFIDEIYTELFLEDRPLSLEIS